MLFLHELLFLSLPPPQIVLIFLPSLLYEAAPEQFLHSWCCVNDDLDCNVDSRTINSTAPPCSGRSSMAATLPLSCFTLEDSLKLLHTKRTQKHLFCQQRRCLTLGSGFHQVIVRLKILAYCSQNNYHPFPPVPYTSPQPS